MRAFSQLPRPLLLMEILGIVLLVVSPFALRDMLPFSPLNGKPTATALLFAAIVLILPVPVVMIWRSAKLLAPKLFHVLSVRNKR
ncbi:YbjC family protein [Erwinia tasmaniensis]|uniref:Inner membrane protein n=1 Tax=Erwinia tasmaniensis (strain DSM 17950 / CFBP 7177 / CIP 109463 / NCPPB 4357 / Et1/99) TaxID=465817 RepID=B2VC48_ERWT9|nr:YbjC family protein [Erwinia tasmaniensis]CAO97226.1 hypothetical protein ETA_21800 [Erwinia tasmaniensis Et1/99]